MAEEIGNLLKKVAIEKVHMKKVSAKSQFVSNLFLVKEKNGGQQACHQFEISLPPFQNGEPLIIERYPLKG